MFVTLKIMLQTLLERITYGAFGAQHNQNAWRRIHSAMNCGMRIRGIHLPEGHRAILIALATSFPKADNHHCPQRVD
jgi:hypothetical protein